MEEEEKEEEEKEGEEEEEEKGWGGSILYKMYQIKDELLENTLLYVL